MNHTPIPTLLTNNSKKRASNVPRGTLLLVGLLFFLVLVSACSPKPKNELVVGMDLSYPPFETIDEAGQPKGVSVELAKALAQSLNRPLRIENIPFAGLIASLQNGRIDCVISSLTDTEERRKTIAFSDPYLTIGLAMLVREGSGVTSLANVDVPGKTIVVRQGTTGQQWAKDNLKQANTLVVDKEGSAVLEVVQGKADAFIYDQMSVWQNQQRNPQTTQAILTPLQKEHWAVGLRKDDETLKQQVNAFIKQYRTDGGFEKLGDQFLRDQKDAFQKEGIPFYF